MNFLADYQEKLSINAATISQEHKIVAKINESLRYNRSYAKIETDLNLLTVIYQNGYLNHSLLSSNGIFNETNEFQLVVTISSYQEHEAGEYFVISYGYIHDLFVGYDCPVSWYDWFLYFPSYFGIIRHIGTLQILTAGKWMITITGIIYQ